MMRIAAYFFAWLLALPGLFFAAAILAINRAVTVGNLILVAWDAVNAFAYGVPLLAPGIVAVCILGFFRAGRIVGGAAALVSSLGALAVMLEGFGSPKTLGDALYLAPTVGSAALAGWLIHAETRSDPQPAA